MLVLYKTFSAWDNNNWAPPHLLFHYVLIAIIPPNNLLYNFKHMREFMKMEISSFHLSTLLLYYPSFFFLDRLSALYSACKRDNKRGGRSNQAPQRSWMPCHPAAFTVCWLHTHPFSRTSQTESASGIFCMQIPINNNTPKFTLIIFV